MRVVWGPSLKKTHTHSFPLSPFTHCLYAFDRCILQCPQ